MTILNAVVADVQIGSLTVQGLMAENGEFGIAVPQMAEYFQFDQNQASRGIKRLLGNGFQFDRWKTQLNPKAVNVVTLEQFTQIVLALHRKGNPSASQFVEAMVGLSLHQLFCDAFGLKLEAEDRQFWLQSRLSTKVDFRALTDQLQRHGFKDGKDFARFIWAFQSRLGIKSGSRDDIPTPTLVKLQGAQVRLITLMECGISPWEALQRIA